MIEDGDVGVNDAVAADADLVAYIHIGHDHGPFAHLRGIADHFMRRREGAVVIHDLQVSLEGLVHDQQRFACRHFRALVDDDITGGRPQAGIVILGMVHKDQVAFFHFVNLIDAGGHTLGIAGQFGADQLRNGGYRYRLIKSHTFTFFRSSCRGATAKRKGNRCAAHPFQSANRYHRHRIIATNDHPHF